MSSPHSPLARRARAALAARAAAGALVCTVALAACGGSDPAPVAPAAPVPGALTVLDGGGQSAVAGAALPAALRVRVTSAQGTPLAGVTVLFTVASGAATVAPASAVTDAQGVASAQVTLGATAGPVVVTAAVQGVALSSTFGATATAPAPTATAACGDPSALMAVGQARVLGTVASLCLPGGAGGAEYALVAFNGADDPGTRTVVVLQSAGIAPTRDAAAAARAPLGASRSVDAPPTTWSHAALRGDAQRALGPHMAAARRARALPTAARADVGREIGREIGRDVAVGALVSLNANASNACAASRPRTGRVVAVGSRSVVVADTGNPTGGFGAADYAAAAATFDTLVAPFAAETFGEPSDVDGNGRVVLFFTRVVNELVPPAGGWYDAGFFLTRDLFPRTAADPEAACAASNAGEVLYLMVPDPRGTINRNTIATATVAAGLTRTLVHEYQHLVNASRRLYGNAGAQDWEEGWLDEGLSHVAEELLFYRVAGLAPRRNLDAAAVRGTAAPARAFESLQLGNLGRLREYLLAPSRSSPFAEQDGAAARGAAWSFLRHAADHRDGAESALWRALANGSASGLANLRAALGTDPAPLLRDWATSLLTDELAGAAPLHQQPSWNLPSLFTSGPPSVAYPLATLPLAGATPLTVALGGGSAAYARFAIAPAAAGTVYWDALPAHVQMTLVRTR